MSVEADPAGGKAYADSVPAAESPWRQHIADLFASKRAVVGFVLLAAAGFIAIFAPWIMPQDPFDLQQLDIMDNMLPPGSQLMSGATAWLGTDDQGRDLLSAIAFGLRTSLFVGVVTVLASSVIGAVIGVSAAFFGRRVDTIIMRIVDIQLSFPSILIALVLLAVFGRGIDKVIFALIAVQWAYYTRTVRASALVEKNKDYVAAAACLDCRGDASCSIIFCPTAFRRSSSSRPCRSPMPSRSRRRCRFSASASLSPSPPSAC